MPTIPEYYNALKRDEKRTSFSRDMEIAHGDVLGRAGQTDAVITCLSHWLSTEQPCLFGKIAARRGLLKFCILDETTLLAGDDAVRTKIQESRLEWLAAGFRGEASGFVIAAISERLTYAAPDEHLGAFAKRICESYLLQEIPFDTIATDSMFLEKPGHARRTWKWLVGANFFGAQGDGRWWHDHRIPGGVAFSMNSVGHMAKAGAINRAMNALDGELGQDVEDWMSTNVESLDKALILAMRTILNASKGARPGTRLYDNAERRPALECPVANLPADLNGRNHCEYFGYYHTDHTLPSDYFRDSIDRPHDAQAFDDLNLTYLFDTADYDFLRMGAGLPIRSPEGADAEVDRFVKRERVVPFEVDVADEPLLMAALSRGNISGH